MNKCRSVFDFVKIEELGQGTYGTVYKALDIKTKKYFALKKIKLTTPIPPDGFPITSLREITILSQLSHPNITSLHEVVIGKSPNSIYLVLEYCETDLINLLKSMERFGSKFHLSQIKSLLLQLLLAVNHLHKHSFIHRDIKLSNILITKNGTLKLTDFGLARKIEHNDKEYTPKLVTLWYRAPEVLLQIGKYSWHCDVWAVGCVFGEMLNGGRSLFPGRNEIEQFELICGLIGKPTREIWEEFFEEGKEKGEKLIGRVDGCKYNKIGVLFGEYGEECVDLMSSLLTWDPKKRICVGDAVLHGFFRVYPYPTGINKEFLEKYI